MLAGLPWRQVWQRPIRMPDPDLETAREIQAAQELRLAELERERDLLRIAHPPTEDERA